MKQVIIFLVSLLTFMQPLKATTYIVAPNGNDGNPGTSTVAPFKTWTKLKTVLRAGDIAYIRGGTYTSSGNGTWRHCDWSNMVGTAAQPIKILAYPGDSQPIFDLSSINPSVSDPTAVYIEDCAYLYIKGLRVTGLKQISSGAGVSRGIEVNNSPNTTLELVEVDHIGGYGISFGNGSHNYYVLNCDVHHLDDRYSTDSGAYGGSNGIQCTGGSNATNGKIEGCRTWYISDDGIDLYGTNGKVEIKNCWSFWNGYRPELNNRSMAGGDGDGFKLGPDAGGVHNVLLRTVTNCLAFENRQHGFNQNNGDMRYNLYNNTSYKNGDPSVGSVQGRGYMWGYISPAPICDFKNNISVSDQYVYRGSEISGSKNTWSSDVGITISSSDFQSVSSVGVDGPRQADGSLPDLPFLKPKAGSLIINRGVNVGLPFYGIAPDLGAYETFSGITLPTANAGPDRLVTLPINGDMVLTGSYTGSGIPLSFQWSKISSSAGGGIRFLTPTEYSTVASLTVPGEYIVEFKVTDVSGNVATDQMKITANLLQNVYPEVDAGTNKTIVYPADVSLTGTATDSDGTISSTRWTKISGGTGGTLSAPNSLTTTASGMQAGEYKFELSATDNNGAVSRDTVTVTVIQGNKVINTRVYTNNLTFNDPTWNNWNMTPGVYSSKLKYTDGTRSSIKIKINKQRRILNNGTRYLVGQSLEFPRQVYQFVSTDSRDRVLTISGLTPNTEYVITVFGSIYRGSASTTQIDGGSGSDGYSTANNSSESATITITSNSQGIATITLTSEGSTENAFTGIVIIE